VREEDHPPTEKGAGHLATRAFAVSFTVAFVTVFLVVGIAVRLVVGVKRRLAMEREMKRVGPTHYKPHPDADIIDVEFVETFSEDDLPFH
jgi:uncharacterized membrane protein SpoIIM required for sporulation